MGTRERLEAARANKELFTPQNSFCVYRSEKPTGRAPWSCCGNAVKKYECSEFNQDCVAEFEDGAESRVAFKFKILACKGCEKWELGND